MQIIFLFVTIAPTHHFRKFPMILSHLIFMMTVTVMLIIFLFVQILIVMIVVSNIFLMKPLVVKMLFLRLANWAVANNITLSALSALLKVLKDHSCFNDIPIDARTVLKTGHIFKPNKIQLVSPGL